jgi:hypothetical protein
VDSVRNGQLVAIIGTGVSMALTGGKNPSLSWKGLVEHGFAYAVKKGRITAKQANAWKSQLDSSDLDDLLGAAEFMGRKLDAPDGDLYARWLEDAFKSVLPVNQDMVAAIRALLAAQISGRWNGRTEEEIQLKRTLGLPHRARNTASGLPRLRTQGLRPDDHRGCACRYGHGTTTIRP